MGFSIIASLLILSASHSHALSLRMSGGLEQAANFAVRQSPSSTRFVTNKMCPYAQKVWIALEVVKAPYDMEEISLYGPDGKPDWFWELNPAGTVPVLECYGGAVVISDSDLILDQIVNGVVEGGNRLAPIEGDNADLVREWRIRINEMLPIGKAAVHGDKIQKNKLTVILQDLDGRAKVGSYLCGDEVTLADCGAFPFLWRLDSELDLEKLKCNKLKSWLKKCEENPAFFTTIQSSWWWWW